MHVRWADETAPAPALLAVQEDAWGSDDDESQLLQQQQQPPQQQQPVSTQRTASSQKPVPSAAPKLSQLGQQPVLTLQACCLGILGLHVTDLVAHVSELGGGLTWLPSQAKAALLDVARCARHHQ